MHDTQTKAYYILVFSNIVFLKDWAITGNRAAEIKTLNLRNKHKSMVFSNLSILKEAASEISTLTVTFFSKSLNLRSMIHVCSGLVKILQEVLRERQTSMDAVEASP